MRSSYRYFLILALVALGAAAAAVGGWRFARVSAPISGPLVLVAVDTLGAARLAAFDAGHEPASALARLAAEGTVFEHAYAHAPQTLPALASLLTGRLPFDHGVRDDVGTALRPGERALSQLLHERGFATAGVVSTYLVGRGVRRAEGFDLFDARLPAFPEDADVEMIGRDDAATAAAAVKWLDAQRSTRFFLFVELSGRDFAAADAAAGRLFDALRARQYYDRATIILTGVHGEPSGAHGERQHPLFLYDDTIHVPLIIKPEAGSTRRPRVVDVVQHADILPTVLDLVRAPRPSELRGRSLRPLIEGDHGAAPQPVYSESWYGARRFGWSPLSASTDGGYRYVRAPREELYDLKNDPAQRVNVADARQPRAQAMRVALERLNAAPASPSADVDPKDRLDVLAAVDRAVALSRASNPAPAIAAWRDLTTKTPPMPEAWRQLGRTLERAGRFDDALSAYGRVAELVPDDPGATLRMGRLLLSLDRQVEAEEQAEVAARLADSPGSDMKADAHRLLAEIALATQDDDRAKREAMLAEQADPTLPVPAIVEGVLALRDTRYDDALAALEPAVQRLELRTLQMRDARFYLGEAFAGLDRTEEAAAQYLDEVKLFPGNLRAWGALAALRHAAGQAMEARQTVGDMVAAQPTPQAYALGAKLLTSFGQSRQAAALRKKVKAESRGR